MEKVRHPGQGSKLTQLAIFKQIWVRSNKKSFISDLFLRQYEGSDFFLSCFPHVLAKGQNKYPYFKFYAKNIVLMHPEEHHLYDNGTEEQRIHYALDLEEKSNGKSTCDWKKLYDFREELEKEYKKHFPVTFMGIINYKYSPEEVIEKIGQLNKEFFKSIDNG